jgi:thioredoxin reductase (NADPH)
MQIHRQRQGESSAAVLLHGFASGKFHKIEDFGLQPEVQMEKIYDVIVVGGGPAGLTAAGYAGRAGLSVLLLEKAGTGGQIAMASSVENYPGGLPGDTGQELANRMAAQCGAFGAERVTGAVQELDLRGDLKAIRTAEEKFIGKSVIVASGNSPLFLGVPGETKFIGRGVSYCATCDGPFFTGLEIFVAGGGDSAVEEAVYLTKFARKVTVIHRRDTLRAAKSIREKALANDKIEFLWDTAIREIRGGDLLESLVVENLKTGKTDEIQAKAEDGTMGLFVFIGHSPNTGLLDGQLELDGGYIVTDEDMRTNLPGVFAAGDVRKKSLRQVVTAAADGAVAAMQAERYCSAE